MRLLLLDRGDWGRCLLEIHIHTVNSVNKGQKQATCMSGRKVSTQSSEQARRPPVSSAFGVLGGGDAGKSLGLEQGKRWRWEQNG